MKGGGIHISPEGFVSMASREKNTPTQVPLIYLLDQLDRDMEGMPADLTDGFDMLGRIRPRWVACKRPLLEADVGHALLAKLVEEARLGQLTKAMRPPHGGRLCGHGGYALSTGRVSPGVGPRPAERLQAVASQGASVLHTKPWFHFAMCFGRLSLELLRERGTPFNSSRERSFIVGGHYVDDFN